MWSKEPSQAPFQDGDWEAVDVDMPDKNASNSIDGILKLEIKELLDCFRKPFVQQPEGVEIRETASSEVAFESLVAPPRRFSQLRLLGSRRGIQFS